MLGSICFSLFLQRTSQRTLQRTQFVPISARVSDTYTEPWGKHRPLVSEGLERRSEGSVGTVSGYGLDDSGVHVQALAEETRFLLLYNVQTGYEAHPASHAGLRQDVFEFQFT
jgi:hypothetical protein